MRYFLLLFLVSLPAVAEPGKWYLDVGAGIKLEYGGRAENKPPTFYGALRYQMKNSRWELAHDSNWLQGPPFNNDREDHKTEIRWVYSFQL